MRALTVRQPWAAAIINDGKNIENRRTNWSYRGPLAIHAGAAWDASAPPVICERSGRFYLTAPQSAIIGTVDLADVHEAGADCTDQCRPWGMVYDDDKPTYHLVLTNPIRLDEPIPCKGKLGLWTVPDDARLA